jgi:hypothetical protein
VNVDFWIGFLMAWCLINGLLGVVCVIYIIRGPLAARRKEQ